VQTDRCSPEHILLKSKTHRRCNTLSFFLFTLFLLTAYCLQLNATIRYVSKTGTSTPPYLTWQTAADSIQKCINISVFGDTIYVANGVYQEQVVMIPGLALIGSGADSCVVDTRNLIASWDDVAIEVADSSLLKGFKIIVSNNSEIGIGVTGTAGSNTLVTMNYINNAIFGAFLDATFYGITDFILDKNVINNVRIGIEMFNSNSVVKSNSIYTDPNSTGDPIAGIRIAAFTNDYTPIIDSNDIVNGNNRGYGITKDLGSSPTITNNIIKLVRSDYGIRCGIDGNSKIFNNNIIGVGGYDGIYKNGSSIQAYNNFVFGTFSDYGIIVTYDTLKNNIVTGAVKGIGSDGSSTVQYNNSWNNETNYESFTPDTTNLSVDPMVVNDDETQGELDFHLQAYSPLIDAGDPTILDRDGSRSDIGLYGGPYGWTYTYQDLAPRPPHNLTAAIEEGLVKLTWNKNTEADFSHYRIYRDTVTIVIYDSTKMIGETVDTFYYDNLPPVNRETRYYYVITAFDNQGNQSYPSEEINVLVTGLGEQPPIGYDGYRLLSNYPNPFNPSTIIPYRLKERGHVRLSIYDLKGELVRVLVNEWQERGYYEVVFQPNAEDKSKITKLEVPMGKTYSHLSSGIYIYSIQVIDERNIPVFTDCEKMILLK
jgi:hypothetical protein